MCDKKYSHILTLCLFFIVQVQLSPFSPPQLSQSPLPNPRPVALSMCPSYMFLGGPVPVIPLSPPLWLLSDCSLFQCISHCILLDVCFVN